jgi:Icc protein
VQRTLLHITDCHLVPLGEDLQGTDTNATLDQVLAQALGEQTPDAIVATGDLVHSGGVAVYRQFMAALASAGDVPLLCTPGNHDFLAPMMEAGLPMSTLQVGPWSIVGLDSHEDDTPKALVDEQRRHELVRLWQQQQTRFALLATHHPLLAIGAPWLDKDRIEAPEALLDSLMDGLMDQRAPSFSGAIFGHAHQEINAHYRGAPLFGTPSTAFQFAPRSETFTMGSKIPGYRWLWLEDDGSVASQVRWLADTHTQTR